MVIKKEGNGEVGKIEQIKLPKWLEELITKKWFLYLFAAVVLVMVIGFSLPASTRDNIANAIFAKTATDGSLSSGGSSSGGGMMGNSQPVVGTATPTPTEGKEKNQISADRNDPILAQRINRLEIGGKSLMPIGNLPQEIRIGKSNLYITSMIVNNKVSGYLENRGANNINIIGEKKFTFITKDYLYLTELPIIYINGQSSSSASTFLKAGEKKSFQTIDTQNINEYQKLGGLKDDLLKINNLVKQSAYIQISEFSTSDA